MLGDRFGGVIGVQEQAAGFALDAEGEVPEVLKGVAAVDDRPAELAGALPLEDGGGFHQGDLGVDAKLFLQPRQRLARNSRTTM